MSQSIPGAEYWTRDFAITDDDLDRIYRFLQVSGRPEMVMSLLAQVVRHKLEQGSLDPDAWQRLKSESAAQKLLQSRQAQVYQQDKDYELGQRLLVAWCGAKPDEWHYDVGEVIDKKTAYEPHYRWTIRLRFADGSERCYIAGADLTHPKAKGWRLFDVQLGEKRSIGRMVGEVLRVYGATLLPHLLGCLDEDDRFVRWADSCWLVEALPMLPKDALSQVATYLWAQGSSAETDALLKILGLPVNEPHCWALNRALAADKRFNNEGTESHPRWASPLPDHLLRLSDGTLIDLSVPPDDLWKRHRKLFRDSLPKEWANNPHVLTFGNRWLLDVLLMSLSNDDLERVPKYLAEQGRAVSDVEILGKLFGIAPQDDAFDRWRFTLSYRLQQKAQEWGMEFVGSGRAWAWALKSTPTDVAAATRAAAAEVLELQRQRKKGLAPPRAESFPVGTRVFHPQYGVGTVVLAAAEVISIRLDRAPSMIVDVPRAELQAAAEQAEAPTISAQAVQTSSNVGRSEATSDIAVIVRDLVRETQEILTEYGLDTSGIYFVEEGAEAAQPPQPIANLAAPVARALAKAQGITTFYSHQIETREHLLAGKHVVIATPTASGKTESYNPTILETLLADPAATALYLFPLVALGFDQVERLNRLNKELPSDKRLQVGILNSDVRREAKRETLRANNRIVVTTPETLHYILLPKPYSNWRDFFRNLRYVVLDEAHVYKGVFGSNMGLIMRRLLARSMREGNSRLPQVIIASATVRDPRDLAHQLTGLPANDFAVVERSGAPRPRRHCLVLPQDIYNEVDVAAAFLRATTTDARTGQRRPVRTILFLRSINEVKRATEHLREVLRRQGREELIDTVADFYADKADKQDVFIRLRQGKVRCLFTTNALMAGIDIGGLDVAVVKNFPGLVMDARQMFGRAARAGEGAAIFLADRSDPFDQFYLERPHLLFGGQMVEPVIANPDNPLLLTSHLLCAAQVGVPPAQNCEGPLSGEWAWLFGSAGADALDSLMKRGALRVERGTYCSLVANPHEEAPLNQLRSTEGEPYRLEDENGNLLEEKRRSYAYRDAHPDAIFWCNGRRYQVVAFDDANRLIVCRPIADYNNLLRTRGLEDISLTVRRELEPPRSLALGIVVGFGEVSLLSRIDKYVLYQTKNVMRCRNRRCRHETTNLEQLRCPRCGSPMQARQVEEPTQWRRVPQPPELQIRLETQAAWLAFPYTVWSRFEREFWPRWWKKTNTQTPQMFPNQTEPEFAHALHTCKHALLKILPEQIRCDEGDIGGFFSLDSNGEARLYVYDTFSGGLGFAQEVYDEAEKLLDVALKRLEECTCAYDDGCVVCLKYFRCRQFNDGLSKLAARYLLRLALGQPTQPVLSDMADYVRDAVPRAEVVMGPMV